MSQRVRRFEPPFGWQGMSGDPVYWRDLGYRLVASAGEERLVWDGVDLAPLSDWFNPADVPYALRLARLLCAPCAAAVGQIDLLRDEQGRGEPVAVVRYDLRRRTDTAAEATVHHAVLHLPGRGACSHGSLLAHVDDPPVTTDCRAHPSLVVPWAEVVAELARFGGAVPREEQIDPQHALRLH